METNSCPTVAPLVIKHRHLNILSFSEQSTLMYYDECLQKEKYARSLSSMVKPKCHRKRTNGRSNGKENSIREEDNSAREKDTVVPRVLKYKEMILLSSNYLINIRWS